MEGNGTLTPGQSLWWAAMEPQTLEALESPTLSQSMCQAVLEPQTMGTQAATDLAGNPACVPLELRQTQTITTKHFDLDKLSQSTSPTKGMSTLTKKWWHYIPDPGSADLGLPGMVQRVKYINETLGLGLEPGL